MVRERIADDIYMFRSRKYAQVTAGAILTKEGVVLIDTLFYPDESQAVRQFLEERLGYQVRYVINTHYHADHTLGTCQFPQAQVVSHSLCRDLLELRGRQGLAQMQAQNAEFEGVDVVLPDIVFSGGHLNIHLGGKTLQLIHLPGHSRDLIGVMVMNEQILFASDTAMPVPTLFDGDYQALVGSLHKMLALSPDTLVQGHGEVILRGEVEALIQDDLAYLAAIREAVQQVLEAGKPESALDEISIESCGKSRIPLNGFVVDLHLANLHKLYADMSGKQA